MRYQPTRSCGIANLLAGRGSAGYARDTPYEIHRLVLIAVSNEGRDAGQQAVAPAWVGLCAADPALPARHLFAWVSAEPLWLAVGHGARGTATVTTVPVAGWTSAAGHLRRHGLHRRAVILIGARAPQRRDGARVGARMIAAGGRLAYAGRPDQPHGGWLVGLALVLLCGLAIAWAGGAHRLPGRENRRYGAAGQPAGPIC